MKSKLNWHLARFLRKVWVRAVSFALLAVVTVVVAQVVAPFIPSSWTVNLGAEAVDSVLNIVASSMLAVTTFSLGIAISAFSAAASSATPRASALLQEDPTAQNVLATFLGAFLFSLVGIIALQAGYYTNAGRLILFVATGIVIAIVVVTLLRWISHLVTFGRMADTLDRVESAATKSFVDRLETPFLGGRPLRTEIPESCAAICSEDTGYIQHIDVGVLNSCADQLKIKIWLCVLPGAFVHEARPIFYTDRKIADDAAMRRLWSAFTIGAERDFNQDPRFGVIVLSEIASRALSPAVNDPGTAIIVVGRLVRILSRRKNDRESEITYPSVFVPPILPADIIDDAFRPIVRDGIAIVEVQIRLQKALNALSKVSPMFAEACALMAADARLRARDALTTNEYKLLEECSPANHAASCPTS